MGNMSKMTTTKEEEKEDFECCICYEQKKFRTGNKFILNGLKCQRAHKVCFACVNKLLNECGDDKCKCLGYNWRCPLCRELVGIGLGSQLIGVISGSWKKVKELEMKYLS